MSAAPSVVKAMNELAGATQAAGKLASTANTIFDMLNNLINKSDQTLMELAKEAGSVERAEVSDFREAMRETVASGSALKLRCKELKDKWDFLENLMSNLMKSQFGKPEVQKCIELLQIILQFAAKCCESYSLFKEKLRHAVDIGSRLAERCKVAAQDARSKATTTKAAGYGTAGLFGAAALGFLTFATGGLALAGAAAAGVAAAATGGYTYDRARKLENLAAELDAMRGQLDNSLQYLNSLGDSVYGIVAITETMVESMEIALNYFKEQESLRRENEQKMLETEKMRQRNEQLQEKLQEMQEEEKREMLENERRIKANQELMMKNEMLEQRIREKEAEDKMKQEKGKEEAEKMMQRHEELEKRIKELEMNAKKKKSSKCRNM